MRAPDERPGLPRGVLHTAIICAGVGLAVALALAFAFGWL